MKKAIFVTILLCSILALAACSVVQTSSTSANSAAGVGQTTITTSTGGQMVLQLALGTLKLESTAYPVDAEQAAQLLPLWKGARSLGKSTTAAAEEMSGLAQQIQNTMTAEQIQAIQAMQLSAQDLPAVAKELGISLGFSAPPVGVGLAAGSSGQAAPQPPGGDMGGMPMDGGGPLGGGAPPSSIGTAQASSNSAGSFLGLDSALLDALITFL